MCPRPRFYPVLPDDSLFINPNVMQKISLRLGWLVLTIAALYLAIGTATYFSFRSDLNFLLEKQDVVHDIFWRTAFYIHIAGGILCLLTGPFQFLKNFRKKHIRIHRTFGKIYITSILFLAGPSGLFMAFFAEGGLPSGMGFALLSAAWMWTTFKALDEVRKGNISSHKNWMTRSMALTLSAVTLRIWVPVLTWVFGFDHFLTVTGTAWLSWIPNLFAAELLIVSASKTKLRNAFHYLSFIHIKHKTKFP